MSPAVLTSAAFIAVLASLTAFIALYWLLAPFHRNPAGRALMVMSCGFWLVTLAQVLRHPFGLSTATSIWFTYFQAAAGMVAIAGIWWITVVLVRVQWQGRRTRRGYFEDREGKP
jgi:hypothetical protein